MRTVSLSAVLRAEFRSVAGHDAYTRLQDAYYAVARPIRVASSSLRALPDFIIVGAQKSGTTSLYKYLLAHPHILGVHRYRPDGRTTWGKEVHYFDDNFDKPEWWYRFHFPLKAVLERRQAITGEGSPQYLYHPHVPKWIARTIPDVKIIICLRNPVNRAISSYYHYVRKGIETLPMREAFSREEDRIREDKRRMEEDKHYFGYKHKHFSYLEKGKYADQVARYLNWFDAKQVMIIKSENMFANVQTLLDDVVDFLGVQSYNLNSDAKHNSGGYKKVEEGVREELADYFRPHNERLYELLDIESPWW